MSNDEERHKAAHRRRRILLDNDGCDVATSEAATAEGLLSRRVAPLVGSQVDTVLQSTHGSFGLCRHDTAVGEVEVDYEHREAREPAFRLIEDSSSDREVLAGSRLVAGKSVGKCENRIRFLLGRGRA